MAIDLGIGDLVGSLFFGGADAAAADVGGAVAADALGGAALGGAADVGAAGAADAALAGGLGGAAGVDALTTDLGAGALDAGALAGDVGLGAAPSSLSDALTFAPDTTAGAVDTGAISAVPAPTNALSGASSAADATATTSPAAALAGSPQIANTLGTQVAPSITSLSGPSTAQSAIADQTLPIANLADSGSVAPAAGGITPAGVGDSLTGDTASALANAPASGTSALSSIESGASSFLNNPLTKVGELALPLGFLGYNLLKGPAALPSDAQQAVENAQTQLAPLQGQANQNVPLFNQTAAQDLNLANNFQISPAQAASIDQYKQDQYNQLLQQIANNGNANPQSSSQWVQGKQQIDQQALAMQVQMVNQLISTAFQSASAANAGVSTATNVTSALDSTLMQAAQLQVQQDAAFQSAIGSALQSFGMLAALSQFGSKAASSGTTSTV